MQAVLPTSPIRPPGSDPDVGQAFQPDSVRSGRIRVRLESLTYIIRIRVRLESLTYIIRIRVRLESLTYIIPIRSGWKA